MRCSVYLFCFWRICVVLSAMCGVVSCAADEHIGRQIHAQASLPLPDAGIGGESNGIPGNRKVLRNPWAAGNQATASLIDEHDRRAKYIEHREHGIITRGTNRAAVMDVIESDIPMLRHLLNSQLAENERENIHNVLAVMIIFAFRLEMPINLQMHRRLAYLHCALSKLFANVGRFTPIHVYLWVQESSIPYLPSWINEMFPEVIVVSIPPSSWMMPTDSGDREKWNYGSYHDDYFLMGRWRLTFAMSFVKSMGYEYILQMDDDTFFMDEIAFNIVSHFRDRNLVWGLRNRKFMEIPFITEGFAELTSYWMRTRNMSEPLGDLFKHVHPPSLDGVTSDGWDRIHYGGCFQLMNVNFWHEEVVQNFVQMFVKLGADMEQRWQEQAVQNMVRLLFVPTQHVFIFEKNLILHGKPSIENLGELGCVSTYGALRLQPTPAEFHANADRLSLLVYLADDTMMELLNFMWECETYEKQFGACGNPAIDTEFILNRHIAQFTKSFILYFNLNPSLEKPLFERASQAWLGYVGRLKMQQSFIQSNGTDSHLDVDIGDCGDCGQ